jgi:hypothetical protein
MLGRKYFPISNKTNQKHKNSIIANKERKCKNLKEKINKKPILKINSSKTTYESISQQKNECEESMFI